MARPGVLLTALTEEMGDIVAITNGVSFQIAAGGDEAKRAFDAMMGMKKIDVAAVKAACRGQRA
jgi:hypothetical protein